MKQERQILKVDERIAETVKQSASEVQTLLQTAINGYKALKIGEINDIAEILEVKKAPETFIKSRLIDLAGGPVNVAGLALNRQKLMDMIDLPDKAVEFIKMLSEIFNEIEDTTEFCRKQTGINVFSFQIKEGAVIPSSLLNTEIEQAGAIYADNENQLKAYKLITEIIGKIDELGSIPGTVIYQAEYRPSIELYLMADPDNMRALIPNIASIKNRIKF